MVSPRYSDGLRRPSRALSTDFRRLVQYEADDGPCVAALGGEMIRIGYIPADERFPHFAGGAGDQRVQSVLSTPAIDRGQVVGSLNVYSRQRDAFDDRARDTTLVMAAEVAHAVVRSVTLSTARTTPDLCRNSRTRQRSSRVLKAC